MRRIQDIHLSAKLLKSHHRAAFRRGTGLLSTLANLAGVEFPKEIGMKQIPSVVLKAPKLEGAGEIEYRLWVDPDGEFYVQFEDNATAGTLGDLLFSVSRYAGVRKHADPIAKPTGYDLKKHRERESANRNDGGFLKAVLRHLLPD